jgi:hypothetical protein
MSTIPRLRRLIGALDSDRLLLLRMAAIFALSGVLHVLVWAIDGGPWAGDVTWRKPIVFGLSLGITTASLVWALGAVPAGLRRRRDVRLFVVTTTIELALIDMQRWRGVASHFNDATAFDGLVFTAMGLLIVASLVPVVRWAITVSRDRGLEPERRAAIGFGLWLLVLGYAIGVTIAPLGSSGRHMGNAALVAAARGLVPAHACALHGIQAMIVASFVLPWFVHRRATRVLLLRTVAIVTVAATIGLAVVGVS